MKKSFIALMLIISLGFTNTFSIMEGEGRVTAKAACVNQSVFKLKYPMQELWIEHAWWTRSFIISDLAGLKDQGLVLERLMKNQEDLGNIIKPYYGEEAGNKLTSLLKEHIAIAGKIIDAAKAGDQVKVDKLTKEWYRNADDIVAFLTSANPNWSKKVLTDMFYVHLKLTIDEVVYRLKGNWAADIKTADTNETHLIHLGEILIDGIVKQFPNKFQ